MNITNQAIDKLAKELENFKGGQKGKAVSSYVAKTLKDFCKEEEFANAVIASTKTLSDCCEEIMKKCGSHISDFEVYKKATQFYFPGAKVDFIMSIKVDKNSTPIINEKTPVVDPEIIRPSAQKKGKKESHSNTIQISLFEL